jgi:nitrite reductase/ring-hydroxylating ferredoxin subunit
VTAAWHRVASRAELAAAKGGMRVKAQGRTLALLEWRGQVFAINDHCPHRGSPLHTGIVQHDGYIACLDHGWEFSLVDGKGRDEWMGCVGRYDVEERGGDIFVLMAPREDPVVRLRLPDSDDDY